MKRLDHLYYRKVSHHQLAFSVVTKYEACGTTTVVDPAITKTLTSFQFPAKKANRWSSLSFNASWFCSSPFELLSLTQTVETPIFVLKRHYRYQVSGDTSSSLSSMSSSLDSTLLDEEGEVVIDGDDDDDESALL
jgi:hypothetical protein